MSFSVTCCIPSDLATNKASAAADRREPRDIVDLVTIHENILPLGAVICAAVGRFPGQSPEEMLADITRHSRFTAEEFRVLATERPIDVPDLHRRIRSMIEDAERFISRIPSDAVGVVFLERENPFSPTLKRLGNTSAMPERRAACGRRRRRYRARCWSATKSRTERQRAETVTPHWLHSFKSRSSRLPPR